ncbi:MULTISPECIES: methyltransferase, FxLD system [Streptomyces]|uniref:Protein-L-isoaspartate O-methyltransferase n=1 Tax=Streptomyces tsukubensis (strain DSM 42081 / NBRC 108919 / NRRL 18488 / 9993) TaxID=1114943 RepID=I2N6K4_STRT9|nr:MULTISPECIES: methyltransferase, FxLD system [Streptomyces]AZK96607.1 methyltransferase, FxLD system [Streptomyces tsukubensis]EIF92651.1 protein-L-isoaspartate(D-aspartate)O-methyltransferase [Streptomyces tsukubensis NRRL18488]MYS67856.1 methyltransferase, FxLD system [Streptomyces sp. SID5473]QKM67390.1 methyltransferase, FxLD system [Streptomyces tsukubensis NRRL18488]TAI42093.1 methyltransferase, FxLD system [Streptomyces tsukubensis]
MDLNDENLPVTRETDWWHATVALPGDAVSPEAALTLSAALSGQRFHFLRKDGGLRLRTEHPAAELLDRLAADQIVSGWVPGVYEPETEAFGGPEAMDVAHDVFCADSRAALAETGEPGGRERSVLLLSTMIRSAGLDPFEAGDVWAKLAALRPPVTPPTGPALDTAVKAMRRLLNADAARRPNPEPDWADRVAAFADGGLRLRRLAADGHLIRGLRAVLAHHAIFAFNRAGVPAAEQAATAWLGRHVAFSEGGAPDVSAHRAPHPGPTLARMETTVTPDSSSATLREALADRLVASGHLHTPAVIDAFRTTDRHEFLPGVDLESAYKEDAVPIKHDEDGEMISCISAPSIVATQLEQLGARPGHTVLEAGAATGYNAGLLGKLVAPGGHVWTVDVDPDLVEGAQKNLAQAGASNVTAVLGDGAAGLPEHAPFDRIQFTVGAGDVPVKLLDQLAPGGRLVLPMRIRGSISRSFAFERDGDSWKTVSCEMATFIPLRKGVCDDIYTRVRMEGEGTVHLETFSEQEVDRDAIRTVLDQKQSKVYTGVKLRQGDPFEWMYLYLAFVLPNGLSRLPGQRPGFTPHFGWGSMAALDGDSLAYLTIREGEDEKGRYWEIGVIGHGSHAAELADHLAGEIRNWDEGWGNTAPEPTFRMAVGDARHQLTATDTRFVIDKTFSRLVVDWPRKG